MAYVFGMCLGKMPLLRILSPKKTVEGFVGAGFSTLIFAAPLLNYLSSKMSGTTSGSNKQHAWVMALYTSLVGPFGGYLASSIKRAHGKKDFGNTIPGHGGLVDRLDCQIITAPFVCFYLQYCKTSIQAATPAPPSPIV
jgi:phosphatidate cytidylyltransferase